MVGTTMLQQQHQAGPADQVGQGTRARRMDSQLGRHSRLALLVFWTLWALILHMSLLFTEKALTLRSKLLHLVVLQAWDQVAITTTTTTTTITRTTVVG